MGSLVAIICAPACGAVPTPPQAVTVVDEASDPGSDLAPTTDPSVTMSVQDPRWPALSQLPEGLTLVTGFRHELPDCSGPCDGPLILQARWLRYARSPLTGAARLSPQMQVRMLGKFLLQRFR